MRLCGIWRHIAICALFLALVWPLRAAAAADELFIGLSGEMNVTPYKNYDPQWTPWPVLGYEGTYAYVRGFAAGLKIISSQLFEFSAFAEYDDTSFQASNSSDKRLRQLSNRHSSAAAGLGLRLMTPYGMLHASGARDMLNNSNGLNGVIGYMIPLEYGALELTPSLGLQWSDAKYNAYYYGVSDKESRKSGLKAYAPGPGIAPAAGLTIDYSLTDAWEIFCGGELVFLDNAVRDSPMVGRTNTYSLMLGFSFNF